MSPPSPSRTCLWTCPECEDVEPLPAPLGMLVWCLGVEQMFLLSLFSFLHPSSCLCPIYRSGSSSRWSIRIVFETWPYCDLCTERHHGWTLLTPSVALNVLVLYRDMRSSNASYLDKAVFQNYPWITYCKILLYSEGEKKYKCST